MAKSPKKEPEVAPKRGDALLKRMLQSKPKPHKEMIGKGKKASPNTKKGDGR